MPASQQWPGIWLTACPCHENTDPAELDVKLGAEGQVYLGCRGGVFSERRCSELEVLDTLGLHKSDLYPSPDKTRRPEDQAVEQVSRPHPCKICRGIDSC